MSFSSTVKEELAKQIDSARHCNIAELAAMVSICGTMENDADKQKSLTIHIENEAVARKCFTLLKKTFNIESKDFDCSDTKGKHGKDSELLIKDPERISEILSGIKVIGDPLSDRLQLKNDSPVLMNECCKRAFIRGAFLASGSISDPNKGYHLEVVFADQDKAEHLKQLVRNFGIEAKIVQRKKSFVFYVKEGSQIVDMLAVMGAGLALMDLENIRILKEMRNTVNRKVNCETANINKTVNAAVKQMEDIRLIEEIKGFQSLPDGLAEIAALRLEYPEATLKELGKMLNPQVGKSGVNHRLRKLTAIADELRGNEEETL